MEREREKERCGDRQTKGKEEDKTRIWIVFFSRHQNRTKLKLLGANHPTICLVRSESGVRAEGYYERGLGWRANSNRGPSPHGLLLIS